MVLGGMMAIKEAFLRFREALRIKRRQEPEPVTKVRELPELQITDRNPRPRKVNNRKMPKSRRGSYGGPGFIQIETSNREKKRELYRQYFVARETRKMSREMMDGSATDEIRQLGRRQYDESEMRMKDIVKQIVRV